MIAETGQLAAASSAEASASTPSIAVAFPSSPNSKTSGALPTQRPHPMQASLLTVAFGIVGSSKISSLIILSLNVFFNNMNEISN